VLLEHDLVVHFVDVIACQDDDVLDTMGIDDLDVLIDRVGSAFIPLCLGHSLARGQDIEALIALGPEKVPAVLQVSDQGMGLVLSCDTDSANARVDRIREGKIDDPTLAAEEHGGLGPSIGEFLEA
jgi:hypothetical protein